MSRLAKSSHVVLREASQLLASYGAPRYLTDRMAILAQVARENERDAVRLMAVVYGCLPEEARLLGDCDAPGQANRAPVTDEEDDL